MRICTCNRCRVCDLYNSDPVYRDYWDASKPAEAIASPPLFGTCLHLGPSLRRPDGRAERIDFPL